MSTKAIENKSNEVASNEVVKPLATLEALLSFKGERVSGVEKLSLQEGIRMGVAMVIKGSDYNARGAFVIADKSRSLKGDDLAAFMASLKSEVVNECVTRANDALPVDAAPKLRDKAKAEAAKVGEAKYNNLGQTLRAAKFILDNPRKVADGISVFTVQQGLAYCKPPTLKEGEGETEAGQSKLECHKVVSKLLMTPGTSQNVLKQAVAKAKETVAKKHEKPDTRTEAQKVEEARTSMMTRFPDRVLAISKDIDGLAASGVKPVEWRSIALSNAVRALAALAGLVIVEAAAPSPAKVEKK